MAKGYAILLIALALGLLAYAITNPQQIIPELQTGLKVSAQTQALGKPIINYFKISSRAAQAVS